MDWLLKLFIRVSLITTSAICAAQALGVVAGVVFCDQCKDGQVSLFDYPLSGAKVAVACSASNGNLALHREETTNWFGNFMVRFDGLPDLSGCYVQVLGNGQGSKGCGAVAGPARSLKLLFRIFDMEMYTVDALLSQPAEPVAFCPRPVMPPPMPITPMPPHPVLRPPAPYLPPTPPLPLVEASACPYWNWTMPEYRCYWKVVVPEMKVAVVFGMPAASRYGKDLTLWQGMSGKADTYRTLLREATTALLNSYNSLKFPYHPLEVIQEMNWALMGSTRQVLQAALRFKRANLGSGTGSCRFTPCK
ncbi:hypothetical protein NMG60_11019465 [Bertholletia excelsa]